MGQPRRAKTARLLPKPLAIVVTALRMSQTSTRYISFETLEMRGPSAATVVKLMMACNDMSLANQALTEWKGEQPNMRKSRQIGAVMYFVRTQLAHLHEGLKVIEAIRADPSLMAHVAVCDPETQQSFQKLISFLPGEPSRREFEQLIGRVRHNLAFHYDESGKLIKNAISDRASRAEARQSSVTRGNTSHLWHFEVADNLLDSIVVRQIWKVPKSANVRVEADKIADRVHQIFLWFVDFAGEFIWRYCKS